MTRIFAIPHVDYEDAGFIDFWVKSNNHTIFYRRIYAGEDFPAPEEFDVLLILGGPQTVTRIEDYPYLVRESNFIKQLVASNKHKIIGVCLGLQLLAHTFSVPVVKSTEEEIGLLPVQFNDTYDPYFTPIAEKLENKTVRVCQWHNDMVQIDQALDRFTLLASSEGCKCQIVRFAENIYGFQCHFEMTRDIIKTIMDVEDYHDVENNPQKYVQKKEEYLAGNFDAPHQFITPFLEKFI